MPYLSFSLSGFRIVYAIIAAYMWLFTLIFSNEYFKHERENLKRYYIFTLITFAATEGVMLSGSFLTAYLCFEILSFSSTVWVIHEENEGARNAAYTYLFIAVAAGLLLFMGLILLEYNCRSLSFNSIAAAIQNSSLADSKIILIAGILIMFGFGAKAGVFPLHIWLPKAHPVAPAPASALLSGILTKVGVYGILMTAVYCLPSNLYFGEILFLLAIITMFLGAVLALFSVNLKRTLACSSMSQIGFILTGIAMSVLLSYAKETEGTELALSGALLHMVNHSCLKLTLFMAAGAVYMNTEKLDLNDIRGFGRNKPLLKIAFLLGVLGIGGVPLFNAYASKTLIHEAIVEGIHALSPLSPYLKAAEWVFLISGGMTLAYMTKLFICIFVEKNNDEEKQKAFDAKKDYMNRGSSFVIFSSSLLFVILGIPAVFKLMSRIMTDGSSTLAEFSAFSLESLKGGAVSILIGAFIYIVLVRNIFIRNKRYVNLMPEKLDLEMLLYRPLFTDIIPKRIMGGFLRIFAENRILKPLCSGLFTVFSFIIRLLSMGTDLFFVFLRNTILKERKPTGLNSGRIGFIRKFKLEASEAYAPIIGNFSFALVLTCIGIVIILISLLL